MEPWKKTTNKNTGHLDQLSRNAAKTASYYMFDLTYFEFANKSVLIQCIFIIITTLSSIKIESVKPVFKVIIFTL